MSALEQPRYTAAEWWAIVSDPTNTDYQQVTGLGPFVAEFQSWQVHEKRRMPATVRAYNDQLRAFALLFHDLTPGEITPAHCRRFIAQASTPSMSDLAWATLRSFFKFLYREEHIEKNPMDRVDHTPAPPRQLDPRDLFDEDERAALANQPLPYDRLLVHVIFLLGLRPFEQRALKVGDVDLLNHRVIIRKGKGGKPGVGRFTPGGELHNALLLHLHTAVRLPGGRTRLPDEPGDYLFHRRGGNRHTPWAKPWLPVSESAYGRNWERIVEHAGVRYRRPYFGRHTFGTELARRGARPDVIQKAMRHARFETTARHYLAQTEADLAEAAALLDPGEET